MPLARSSVCVFAVVVLLMGIVGADDMDDLSDFREEQLPVPLVPQYELQDSVAYPAILPHGLPEPSFELDDDTTGFPTPLKRGRYNRLELLKRSSLNRLIQRLLLMRGDRYSNARASPVRFAAGRR